MVKTERPTDSLPSGQQDAEKLQSLRKAWQEGIDSGDAGEMDFPALKQEARARRVFATVDLPDEIVEANRAAVAAAVDRRAAGVRESPSGGVRYEGYVQRRDAVGVAWGGLRVPERRRHRRPYLRGLPAKRRERARREVLREGDTGGLAEARRARAGEYPVDDGDGPGVRWAAWRPAQGGAGDGPAARRRWVWKVGDRRSGRRDVGMQP